MFTFLALNDFKSWTMQVFCKCELPITAAPNQVLTAFFLSALNYLSPIFSPPAPCFLLPPIPSLQNTTSFISITFSSLNLTSSSPPSLPLLYHPDGQLLQKCPAPADISTLMPLLYLPALISFNSSGFLHLTLPPSLPSPWVFRGMLGRAGF